MPPATKCSSPCQVTGPGPLGVPGGKPKCRRVRRPGPADPDRGCDRHQARDDEVGDLDPAEPAVGQQAQVVARQVEPLAGQSLDQADSDIDGSGEYAAAEQGASAAWRGLPEVGRDGGREGAAASVHDLLLRLVRQHSQSPVAQRAGVTAADGDSSHGRGRVWRAQ